MNYTQDDIDDMVKVLSGREWGVYKKFLSNRVLQLKDKTLIVVRAGNIVEAQKSLAVVDDIQRQVDMFKKTRIELENDINREEK